MKKQLPGFAAGVLTAALICSLGITALAVAGGVTFNASALRLNGQQISAAGENYTLANGQSVPASITYTDEKGGGTTYLPVRRISELLGVETGWDGATGSVTVKGEVKAPATPETTTPPTDYSDWSKEDEAAYQEFKGLWAIEKGNGLTVQTITAKYVGTSSENEIINVLLSSKDNIARLAHESADKNIAVNPMGFYCKENRIANVVMYSGDIFAMYVGDTRIE